MCGLCEDTMCNISGGRTEAQIAADEQELARQAREAAGSPR